MLHRAYRLTAEDDMLRSKVFSVGQSASLPRKANTNTSNLVRAYETPELAAYCSPEWLLSEKRKIVVVRETISLPDGFGLHDTMQIDKPWLVGDENYLVEQMTHYMNLYKLLSVWAPSPFAPQQHMVLINVQHAAYARVQVSSRRITMKKSTGTLQSEEAIAEI